MTERESRLNEVLAEYLEQSAAGAAPDLEGLLAEHSDLASEIEAFIRNSEAFDRVAGPLRESFQVGKNSGVTRSTPLPTSPWRPQAPIQPVPRGRMFGDYEILEEIASGGMGIVYKARQLSLNRIVALKRIRAGALATAEDLLRFRAEAEEAANLDHPNIVPIYEIGIHEGQSFFSMKLIDGADLAHAKGSYVADTKRTARLMIKIAKTIHYAHQRSVVHRDLKPANVLIDLEDQPHITDFGLAKRLDANRGFTESGAIVGTPSYMAPEQAVGAKQLTTAVDVYSLGAILYELLTGQAPFRSENPLEVLSMVVEAEPASPRLLSLHVDRDLETICLKCLRKDPQKRYSSAEALADDLERWLACKPIRARRTSRAERFAKWVRRRPGIAASLLISIVLPLVTLGVVWRSYRQTLASHEAQEKTVYLRTIALAEREQAADSNKRALALLESEACPERLRGWEWHYLRAALDREARVLRGHAKAIFCVAVSPDGRSLASGSGDTNQGEVILWDLESGKERHRLPGHRGWVRGICFAPDSGQLATASGDRTVRIWDVSKGQALRILAGPRVGLWTIAWSPNGRYLAAAGGGQAPGDDGEITIWDCHTWEICQTIERKGDRIWRIAFHPGGGEMAASGEDHAIKVWQVGAWKLIRSLEGHRAPALNVCYNSDGRWMATSSGMHHLGDLGEVLVWDATTGKLRGRLEGHGDEVWGLAFHPGDANRLFSSSHDRTIKVWDVGSWQEALTLRAHQDNVRAIAITPDGTRLISASEDGTLRVWDTRQEQPVEAPSASMAVHNDRVWCSAFSTDARLLATACEDGSIRILDAATGAPLQSCLGHDGPVRYLAFSPNGKLLASASYDNSVRIWSTFDGSLLRKLPMHEGWVHGLAFKPDGAELATVNSYRVSIWDLRTGSERLSLGPHEWVVSSVVFTPDGRTVITGGWDQVIKVWDAESGSLRKSIHAHRGRVRGLAAAPGGRSFASVGHDGTLKIWRLPEGIEERSIAAHEGKVLSVAYSPGGQLLATVGTDEACRIWRANTGTLAGTLRGHVGSVRHAVFAPKGMRLAVSSGEPVRGECRIWNLEKLVGGEEP